MVNGICKCNSYHLATMQWCQGMTDDTRLTVPSLSRKSLSRIFGKTPMPWGPSAGVVVVVCQKVRLSYISKMVWPEITKFYKSLHTRRTYEHTGYDVTSYFQSAFIAVRKTTENAVSDGVRSNFRGAAFCLPHQLEGILLISCWLLNVTITKISYSNIS